MRINKLTTLALSVLVIALSSAGCTKNSPAGSTAAEGQALTPLEAGTTGGDQFMPGGGGGSEDSWEVPLREDPRQDQVQENDGEEVDAEDAEAEDEEPAGEEAAYEEEEEEGAEYEDENWEME